MNEVKPYTHAELDELEHAGMPWDWQRMMRSARLFAEVMERLVSKRLGVGYIIGIDAQDGFDFIADLDKAMQERTK